MWVEPKSLNFNMEINMDHIRKRCLELEEKSKMAEERCLVLESEKIAIENELKVLKKRNEELEVQITRLGNGNKVSGEGERAMGRVVDLTDEKDEEDKKFQLMVENKVLECEKRKAESELEVWKGMFKELESGMKNTSESTSLKDGFDLETNRTPSEIDKNMVVTEEKTEAATGVISTCNRIITENLYLQISAGTPSMATPCKKSVLFEGGQRGICSGTNSEYGSRVKRQLPFEVAASLNKKIAPSTPAGFRPPSVGVINIGDSDDEPEADSTVKLMPTLETPKAKMLSENNLKRNHHLEESDDEDMDGGGKGSSPILPIAKRRRASNIVNSDSESSDDDNIPIGKLRSRHIQELQTDSHLSRQNSQDEVKEVVTRRRRLVSLRKCEVEDGLEMNSPRPNNLKSSFKNEDLEENGTEDSGSESEGDSLGGFITDGSEDSGSVDSPDESEDTSHGDTNLCSDADSNLSSGGYTKIISGLRRKRSQSSKWVLEGEMLADFNNDPELCMKAVCCLYRQQTVDEKDCKGTIHLNHRGFSHCDASRGTKLAEFLTDGDPDGDLTKSVEELKAHDSKGIELCRTLATHYSKQLFAIYMNKEDPYFLPS